MGFSSAVLWWKEWQLRILVLASLGVQLYLALFAPSRKIHIRPIYRFFIWLSYLGSDALAIYALATLFNRHKNQQYKSINGSSHDLEVLWAPILLMHLGGQITISAYNIKDNALWRRHILIAVSQITVALYAFCKSWSSSGDQRLLAAAILLFILGVLKCFNKPFALKRASFDSLVSSFQHSPGMDGRNKEIELEQYIQRVKDLIQCNQGAPTIDFDYKLEHLYELCDSDKLFVDFAYAYPDRLTKLKSFLLLTNIGVYEVLSRGISRTFDIIYRKFLDGPEKARKSSDIKDHLTIIEWLFTIILPIVAISLFHSSHKEAYNGSDIKVTYALLYITYSLEIFSTLSLVIIGCEWSETVAQHSLIRSLQCKGFLSQYWCMKPCYLSFDMTNLVNGHIRDGWTNYIQDVESYWKFNDIRGHWTLERNVCEPLLGWSLEKPFDESIIIWHVATDFYFHHNDTPPSLECVGLCREISNYMMHLLFANPEMLLTGSRRNLCTIVYNELETILKGHDLPKLGEKEITKKIVVQVKSGVPTVRSGSIIHDAMVLSEDLMKLGDGEKIWEVMRGVWIEMFCFSAGRCRGYLHAKSLGTGGEYLTFVSLLMSHLGLETVPERQQRVLLRLPKEERVKIAMQRIPEAGILPQDTGHVEEQENATSTSASRVDGAIKEEENGVAPSASEGEGTAPEITTVFPP